MIACAVVNCALPAHVRGFCRAHYQRILKWGHTKPDLPINRRMMIGRRAESLIASHLAGSWGRTVERQDYYAPFDLLIDGTHRVELKTAQPSMHRGKPHWRFNIHRHGKLVENCDFYLFRLEKVPFSKAAIHLVVPAPIGKKTIIFSFRSLLSDGSQYVSDFYRLARGEMPPRERAA